jgi:transcriptional regulator with XRE-family HTH domain
MSQEELAYLVGEYLRENEITEKGYSHASIGRMENGRLPYSQPIMEAIAKTLGVSVATLITTPPPKKGEPLPPDPETLLHFWNEGLKASRRQ